MAVLSAISDSARQLYLLLRCVGFAPKAQVQILAEGLRFSVEDSRVMQGLAFLDKSLFTSYRFEAFPGEAAFQNDNNEAHGDSTPYFQISLPALLETLQIFGATDSREGNTYREGTYSSGINDAVARNSAAPFGSRTLGMTGTCSFTYEGKGHPFRVHMEEGKVNTICDLVVYEPDWVEDIPFGRESLALKVIMGASLLHDAINELATITPERLLITASPESRTLSLSGNGNYGSAEVDFVQDAQLLETFQVPRRTTNSYKFSMVRSASRAMAVAAKVSIRKDSQGVLSLQFMVETENGGVSFVDFRFVPYAAEAGEASDDGNGDQSEGGSSFAD